MKNHQNSKLLRISVLIMILVPAFFLTSCNTAGDFTDKPVGNQTDITLKNDSVYSDYEILCICMDTMYTLGKDLSLRQYHLSDITHITVNGYDDRSWLFAILGVQVAPAIILGVTASAAGMDGGMGLTALLLIPAVLDFVLFEATTPDAPKYSKPIKNKTEELRKYARYPYELPRDQLDVLLSYYRSIGRNKITLK